MLGKGSEVFVQTAGAGALGHRRQREGESWPPLRSQTVIPHCHRAGGPSQ